MLGFVPHEIAIWLGEGLELFEWQRTSQKWHFFFFFCPKDFKLVFSFSNQECENL